MTRRACRTAAGLVLALPLLAACAAHATASRTFPVGAFDRIDTSSSVDVRVHTGPAPSVRADVDARTIDHLTVEVHGGVLRIGARSDMSWSWSGHRPRTIVTVTVPGLVGAAARGSGDLAVDRVRSPRFDAVLVGSGGLSIAAVEAQALTLTLQGSGDLSAAGHAARVEVRVTGSGDVAAKPLRADDLRVLLTGAGDVAMGAARTADLSLDGSGDIEVAGRPRCTVANHGAGNIRCGD